MLSISLLQQSCADLIAFVFTFAFIIAKQLVWNFVYAYGELILLDGCGDILSNFLDEELVNDVEMKDEEEAKPIQTTSTKKKKEESIEDKREHINIIFIGHVGKTRI